MISRKLDKFNLISKQSGKLYQWIRFLTEVPRREESSEESRDEDLQYPKYPKQFVSRNPRSLELLGIVHKPKGYTTKHLLIEYYHQLVILFTNFHTYAHILHNSGVKVIEASTREFEIASHLYSTTDVTASRNLGRVLANRLFLIGIRRISWDIKKNEEQLNKPKILAFFEGITEQKLVTLSEPKLSTNYEKQEDFLLKIYKPDGYEERLESNIYLLEKDSNILKN